MKICKICKIEKDLSEFCKKSSNKYRNECRKCKSEYLKLYYKKDPKISEYTISNSKKISIDKICKNCNILKDLNSFPRRNDSIDGHRNKCYDCFRLYNRLYYNENRDRDDTKIKIRRKRNRNKIENKIANNIRNSIKRYLKSNKIKKSESIEKILGISKYQFRIHIESQFLDGMNWENREKWHIDHIIPISFGKNKEEIIMLNHYTNLRPIWKFDNLSKNKFITLINEIYNDIMEKREIN